MNDSEKLDLAPDSSGWNLRTVIRLAALFVVFLVLPMLLLAAMTHPQGCGGG